MAQGTDPSRYEAGSETMNPPAETLLREAVPLVGKVPKILWIYWDSGFETAPWLVRGVLERWRECLGTEWKIVALTRHEVEEYIDIPMRKEIFEKLAKAHQADLIRVALLERYGGLWSDATVWCHRRPESWLPKWMESGFFAFEKPSEGRAVSNWFLAAEPDHYIVRRLREEFSSFFETYRFPEPGPLRRFFIKKMIRRIERRGVKATKIWFSPLMTRFLKVYPYFTFHYLFNYLLEKDVTFADYWNRTPKVASVPLHRLKRHGLMQAPDREIVAVMRDASLPLFKLDWKNLPSQPAEGSLAELLFRRDFTEKGVI